MRGKAVAGSAPLWVLWDHPRTCGEKPTLDSHAGLPLGSPPHMRGKVERCILSAVPTGITPAHAGKSTLAVWANVNDKDHPRTCGEKSLILVNGGAVMGSPPHMRGKVGLCRGRKRGRGITPAHAGKSTSPLPPRQGGKDHPRTCGEKFLQKRFKRRVKGSPPHMRGKGKSGRSGSTGARITPAHAGKRA